MVSTKGNKYVYIKPDFLAESQSTSHSPTAKGSSKILVNPNFKASVFLNPHFNKSNAQSQKMKIHINPHILKNDYRGLTMKSNMTYVKKGMSEEIFTSDNNVLMDIPERVTTTKLARVEPQKSNSSEPYITKHKYKLVRQNVKTKQANTKKISLNSNKSLVNRNVVNHKRKLVQVQSCIHPQMYITRSKFKLVKRQIHHKQTFKWCRIKNTSTPVNKISEDIIVKKKPRKLTRYVWLNSTLHRRSADVLRNNHIFDKKALKQHNSVSQPGVRKLIYTHGVKYMVGRNQKVLRLLPSGEKHTTKKILRRSRVEKKLVKLARFPRTKKCNVPCMFYRKYGRCRQHERGMCSKVHDPNQIIVCPRFLQGACINKTCLLSHDLSPEKMPTCKFFLEGLCSKETCPYPHVKVNPKADICQEFLRGFCKKGRECDNRHQYLCPAFEKHGKCSNKKCYYPHGNEIKKGAIMALSLSCRKSERQQNNDSKVAKLPVTNNMEQSEEKKGPRYYMDLGLEQIKDCENPMAVAQERQKIGDLPCFIPFPM